LWRPAAATAGAPSPQSAPPSQPPTTAKPPRNQRIRGEQLPRGSKCACSWSAYHWCASSRFRQRKGVGKADDRRRCSRQIVSNFVASSAVALAEHGNITWTHVETQCGFRRWAGRGGHTDLHPQPCLCSWRKRAIFSFSCGTWWGSAMEAAFSKRRRWIWVGRSFHCKITAAPRHRKMFSSSSVSAACVSSAASQSKSVAPPSLSQLASWSRVVDLSSGPMLIMLRVWHDNHGTANSLVQRSVGSSWSVVSEVLTAWKGRRDGHGIAGGSSAWRPAPQFTPWDRAAFWRNDPSIESWRRPVPLVRVHGIGTFWTYGAHQRPCVSVWAPIGAGADLDQCDVNVRHWHRPG